MNYDDMDEEKVIRHLYDTLTATIDFLANRALELQESRDADKATASISLMHQFTDLQSDVAERWITEDDSSFENEESSPTEEEMQEAEDRAKGVKQMEDLGADAAKIMFEDIMEDAKREAEQERVEDEELWDRIAKDSEVLPEGWPLDYK